MTDEDKSGVSIGVLLEGNVMSVTLAVHAGSSPGVLLKMPPETARMYALMLRAAAGEVSRRTQEDA